MHDYLLSTTYLKVLLNEPELIQVLQQTTGDAYRQWFDRDYVHRADIQPVFEAFDKAGLDSWVMKFGDRLDSTTHGPLGFAVLSAPDLRTALSVFTKYSDIRTTAYTSELLESSDRLAITAVDRTGSELVGRWLIETGMKVTQRLIENLMAHPLGDHALIRFAYPEPHYAARLQDYFQIPCEYNAEQNSISIPASWGQVMSPLADVGAFNTNLAKCKELQHALSPSSDVLESVQIKLETFFNDCASNEVRPTKLPSLSTLAQSLAMSPRTLSRRLEQKHSSYKHELEAARKAQAINLLLNTHFRIADIAYYLAYQEPANFIRAFKNWFQVTPTQWRRNPSRVETPKTHYFNNRSSHRKTHDTQKQ